MSAVYADGWTNKLTRLISLEFSLYQPSIHAFASVRAVAAFTLDGDMKTSIAARTFPLFSKTYQPSIGFEIVIAILLIVQVPTTYGYAVSALNLQPFAVAFYAARQFTAASVSACRCSCSFACSRAAASAPPCRTC